MRVPNGIPLGRSTALTVATINYAQILKAFKHQLKSALPIDNMYLGWPTRKGALSSYTAIRGVTDYDTFMSGHATWSHNYLREIVPHGKQITIFREPVSQFVSSWNHWHPYEHIVSMGGPDLTMNQFLQVARISTESCTR
jgi:hypothetical protein